MAQLNFNAREVAPSEAFEPVPPSWYNVAIIESENKPTSNNTGSYLYLVLKILDGPFAGRKLFDRLNLVNSNQQTVEIAYRTLSAICHAVGVLDLQDSQQLHGIQFEARATVRPASTGANGQQYEAQNELKGYRAFGAGQNAPSGAPVASMPAAAPAPVPTASFVRPTAAVTAAAPSAAPVQPTTTAPQQAAAPAQAGSSTPPWLRGKAPQA